MIKDRPNDLMVDGNVTSQYIPEYVVNKDPDGLRGCTA